MRSAVPETLWDRDTLGNRNKEGERKTSVKTRPGEKNKAMHSLCCHCMSDSLGGVPEKRTRNFVHFSRVSLLRVKRNLGKIVQCVYRICSFSMAIFHIQYLSLLHNYYYISMPKINENAVLLPVDLTSRLIMCRLNSCCCFASLETGNKIIAVIGIILGVIALLGGGAGILLLIGR